MAPNRVGIRGFLFKVVSMAKPKEKYKPFSFESDRSILPRKKDGSLAKDNSANIYNSMLLSKAWHNLSAKQKELYLCCKAQYYGEQKKKSELMTEDEIENGVNADLSKRFTMNKSKWCEIYGLYTENTQRYFYSDMKALVQNGFIIVVENGRYMRTKNIYEFSEAWRGSGVWR